MRRVDQSGQRRRTSIVHVRGERRDAVVPPVARPRERSDRHDLDSGVERLRQLGHVARGSIGGAFRRIGAEVDLAEDQLFEGHARTRGAGRDLRQIHDLARPMHALRLQQRSGVWTFAAIREAVEVACARPDAVRASGEVALGVAPQRHRRSTENVRGERVDLRRPDAKVCAGRIENRSEPGLPGHLPTLGRIPEPVQPTAEPQSRTFRCGSDYFAGRGSNLNG